MHVSVMGGALNNPVAQAPPLTNYIRCPAGGTRASEFFKVSQVIPVYCQSLRNTFFRLMCPPIILCGSKSKIWEGSRHKETLWSFIYNANDSSLRDFGGFIPRVGRDSLPSTQAPAVMWFTCKLVPLPPPSASLYDLSVAPTLHLSTPSCHPSPFCSVSCKADLYEQSRGPPTLGFWLILAIMEPCQEKRKGRMKSGYWLVWLPPWEVVLGWLKFPPSWKPWK